MEMLMQYMWQHRLQLRPGMRTVDGRPVRVIDPGRRNNDAGPDFFNAKIEIGGKMWVGNVEIHVAASDWFRHHHDRDEAYDTVILHVVGRNDATISRKSGETIPQIELPCNRDFNRHYHALTQHSAEELPCRDEIKSMPGVYLTDWISTLGYERIYRKVDHINEVHRRLSADWEETAYVITSRGLGFGTNSEPFERLALSTPLRVIRKHADNLLSVEALLFGQAGFLDDTSVDHDYYRRLQKEYAFLKNKFGLDTPVSLGWKMARMRPQNFPHRRIALLALLLHSTRSLMSHITAVTDTSQTFDLFNRPLTGYWMNHYNFGGLPTDAPVAIGHASVSLLLINVVAPLTYAYAISRGDTAMSEHVPALLMSMPPERNHIISLFTGAGVKCDDAFTSQALIQLRREYCEPRKCLYCRIGHRMLSAKATP